MNELQEVESFSRLQAALMRPFARREAILADAGLDEASLRALQARWSGRLAEADAAPLRARYAAVFSASIHPELTPRTHAVADAAVDETLPIRAAGAAPLPFAAAPAGVVPPAVLEHRGAGRKAPAPSSDTEETAWLPPGAHVEPVTPFATPTQQGSKKADGGA